MVDCLRPHGLAGSAKTCGANACGASAHAGSGHAGSAGAAVAAAAVAAAAGPSGPVRRRARPRPARTALPAREVPVAAICRAGSMGRPGDYVRGTRHDLLIAAGAPVCLGSGRAGHLPDHPVTVRPGLSLRRPEADGAVRPVAACPRRAAGRTLPRPARDLRRQAACLTRAHGRRCALWLLPGWVAARRRESGANFCAEVCLTKWA